MILLEYQNINPHSQKGMRLFYEEQLSPVDKKNNVYKVKKVMGKMMVLVKWLGHNDFEMENFIKEYLEYDTIKYSNLEGQMERLINYLLHMDNRYKTNTDKYKETNVHLRYAKSVLENKIKRTAKFKTTVWVDFDKDYKERYSSVI